jgi:hypothetical protein
MLLNAVLILRFADLHPTANPSSRLATVDSLVHRHSFSIDESRYIYTPDKVKVGNHFISSKMPLWSVAAAGGYGILHAITGWTFDTHEKSVLMFMTILTGLIPQLLLLLYFYRMLLVWTTRESARIFGFACMAFSWIGLGYATGINNHTPAATAVFIAFFYAWHIRHHRQHSRWTWLLAGLLTGLAPTLELWSVLFSAAFFLYVVQRDMKKAILVFIPAACLCPLINALFTWISTGSVLPVYLQKELYFYEGSYWLRMTGIDALREPKIIYFFHMLLGHHGYFSMTPVLILGAWELIRSLHRRHPRFAEAMVIGIPTLLCMLALGIRTRNYGGICFGFRWLILTMPLMLLFVAAWLERIQSCWWRVVFLILFVIGCLHTGDALRGTWRFSMWHQYFEQAGWGSLQ